MKKILLILMVFILSINFIACSTNLTSKTSTSPLGTSTKEAKEKECPKEFAIGDTLIFPEMFEITMTVKEFTKIVKPTKPHDYYTYYEAKDKDKVFLHTIFKIKNLKNNGIAADEILNVNVLYDGKYKYSSFSAIEESGGGDLTYSNISSIDPLTIGVLHFITEVPLEVKNSGKPVQLSITANNNTVICNDKVTTPKKLFFGQEVTTSNDNTSWKNYTQVQLNKKVTESDYVDMTVKKAEITSLVKPSKARGYYSYYEVKDKDKIYAHLAVNYKNLKPNAANADEIAHIEVIYDNNYTYTGFSTIENNVGSDFTYTNISAIDPLDTGTIHYIFEVPKEVKTSKKPLVFVISLNSQKYYYQLIK